MSAYMHMLDRGPGPDSISGEEDLVPISALEHYSYCPRQCALIHLEQTFDENVYTLRGQLLHERADAGESETLGTLRIERALPVWSATLGLVGKVDVVELRASGPYPVEYKHGAHAGRHADVQLCAQAMCLEEMTGQSVLAGAVYEFVKRRRREVTFTAELRARVRRTIDEVRALLRSNALPAPEAGARCRRCSLKDSCLPTMGSNRRKTRHLYSQVFSLGEKK